MSYFFKKNHFLDKLRSLYLKYKEEPELSGVNINNFNNKEEEEMSQNRINTRVLPGFMELLPAEQIIFDRMKSVIKEIYELYGFVPIDTPVIERAEVLLAKAGGETEKQIYRFSKGDNDLALRFDLTVPLARYVAEHANDLTFPFRRYHIGKVYRGESPQKGRYREFYQCDIDIIGDGSLSLINDAEIPRVIYDVFAKLGIGAFIIRLSNRKLITGLLNSVGVGELAVEVMRVIDKIDKVGEIEVRNNLVELGLSNKAVQQIFDFLAINGSTDEIISSLKLLGITEEGFIVGISELSEVIRNMMALGMPDSSFAIDLSIARGLDYYTGTVYETTLVDYPKIGSVCSGGRFDNLAEKYTDRRLPGVGISIGLTRLFSQLKDVEIIKPGASTPSKVLIISLVENSSIPLEIATMLREQGISTEVYLEGGKMKKKMAYADKIGVPFVVVVGEDEISSGMFAVKNMITRQQSKVSKDQIFSEVARQ